MRKSSRYQFLRILCAVTALILAPSLSFAQNAANFEMLVVGDSLIWGQGLEEKDKTYNLVKHWLQSELKKEVNLKVKAHSGAMISLHDDESELLKKANYLETDNFFPEVTVTVPTLKTQIQLAKNEYEKEGKSADAVKLILLTGGIVDISVARILNPFGNNKKLKEDITKYCNHDMSRFLDQAAATFPNALLVVVGYFPIFSPQTNTAKAFNATLEAYSLPRPLKLFANNILTRPIFLLAKSKAISRSRIWLEDSNRELQNAVNYLNERTGKQMAVFVESPLTEENGLETQNTLLFRMGKKGKTNDPLYEQRRAGCREVLGRLKKISGLKNSIRQCEIAAIGHPNPDGARLYAESITTLLQNVWLSAQ